MDKYAQIQVSLWEKPFIAKVGDYKLELGEQVVVKTEAGFDMGRVMMLFIPSTEPTFGPETGEAAVIVRKVTTEDVQNQNELNKQKAAGLDYCKKMVDRLDLPMKVIDVHFSFDGSRIVFPFIADGRIDFRQLVKDLTHHFQKSIRLQQIGIRDEAKIAGDVGTCGRTLCCKTHLKELASITSELADVQQIAHRGSERLSGSCGRLRCCLAYEQEVYNDLVKNLPPIGSQVKTPQGKGKVIGWHTLKQTVDVVLEGDDANRVEVAIKSLKNI
ncbi:MAG: regulatory iron-sulfur-containing complex subunit RicT [Candidatus Buchananbacteria bacterium]